MTWFGGTQSSRGGFFFTVFSNKKNLLCGRAGLTNKDGVSVNLPHAASLQRRLRLHFNDAPTASNAQCEQHSKRYPWNKKYTPVHKTPYASRGGKGWPSPRSQHPVFEAPTSFKKASTWGGWSKLLHAGDF